jgi:hypothetical protein
MNLFETIKRFFFKKPQLPLAGDIAMQAGDPQMALKILGMLEKTQEEELTCDDVFALLDQFTEMAARGENVSELMPLVKLHLDICGDCREEYEALLNVIQHPA